tara:strand:+ start:364 stop:540 length:177 start_codon:yes stop_codon:yes gene_type:complete
MQTKLTTNTPRPPEIIENLNNFKDNDFKNPNLFDGRPNRDDDEDRDNLPIARFDLKIT